MPVTESWPPTPQRWTDPAWRRAALDWTDLQLAERGRRRTAWTLPHARPWSAAFRIETDADPVWLKANSDGTRYEAALLALLAALDLPSTPRPLAVDADRGLTLLPDGGPTSREAHGGRTPLPATEAHLVSYAALQRATEPHTSALLGVGVPDARPGRMPALLAAQLDRMTALPPTVGLTEADVTRLRMLLPAYDDACAELSAVGVVPTLQHDDLHDGNVFARGPVFFDWGDAVVGHPFGTLLATLRSVASHHGLACDDPALVRLADAYTESWTDVADRATLRRQLDLAVRVGPLTRALAWLRAVDGADDLSHTEYDGYAAGWLLELEVEDLPLTPPRL